MKKCILILTSVILLSSCAVSIPRRMDSFVDKAELKADSYSIDDWEKSIAQYRALVDEYNSSDRQYSDAERQMAVRAMGRYHFLLLKEGLAKGASMIKGLGEALPEYIDGFSEGLKQNSGEIEGLLKSLVDTTKLNKALKNLEETLQSLFPVPETE